MNSGLFITIEGGEGAGKSTLVRNLTHELENKGYTVLATREPGGSPTGESIRQLLLDNNSSMTPISELLLFLASRAEHIADKIKPALSKGTIVLCDRFNDSSIVYQGLARGLGFDLVRSLCNQTCGSPVPDLTLYLDITPEQGLARAERSSGKKDRIEQESLKFHTQVREGFQKLAKMEPDRIKTLDGTLPQKRVLDHALHHITDKLAAKHV
jgi:dTMP kinase